jgi:hypothetical protein
MSERYHNIFDYWRPKRKNDTEKEEVLENNVTKALLNTLELCPNLGTKFITWLNEKLSKECGLSLEPPNITELRILENPTDEEIKKKAPRIMLGIKKYNGECVPGKKGKGNVDGTIVGQEWLIAIESKLGDMYTRQLQKEKERLGTEKSLIITWQEIHDFFDKLDKEQREPLEKLFIEHLTAYLKAIGQLPFPGFESRHFALFSKSRGQWQDKDRKEFKDLMKTLRGDLYHYKYDGEKELNRLYWEYDAEVKGLRGKRPPDSVDIRYYPRELGEPIFVDIQVIRDQYQEEPYLAVFASVEKEEALRSLSRRINTYRDKLLRVLKNRKTKLDDYNIELLDANKDWEELTQSCRLGHITKDRLRTIESKLWENATKKGTTFFISRYFKEDEITNANKEHQVKMIAEAMITLYPFVQFATKGKRWKEIEWRLI